MTTTQEPQKGARTTCSMCNETIEYIGPYWRHIGEIQPRHPALPAGEKVTGRVELRIDLDAIERRLDAAREKVGALCHGDRWTMSIPAREDYDSDLIIGAALRDAHKMLVALRSLLGKE